MKGLLQSKKFRKNLSKWLFMYVGVMLLLTTVVTYSKYISKFQGNDEAKTARFELRMACIDNTGNACPQELSRMVEKGKKMELNYVFDFDPSKLDVKSNLKLLIFVNKWFIIEGISGVNDVNEVLSPVFNGDFPENFPNRQGDVVTTTEGNKIYKYSNAMITSNSQRLQFGVTVRFNQEYYNQLSTDSTAPTSIGDVVTVNYIVEQTS